MKRLHIVAMVAVVVAGLVPAGSAAAVQGCSPDGPRAYTCLTVREDGLYIKDAAVIRGKEARMCEYHVRVTVARNGKVVFDESRPGNRGCGYGRAYVTVPVDRVFANGDVICGEFYELGDRDGNKPCLTIKP